MNFLLQASLKISKVSQAATITVIEKAQDDTYQEHFRSNSEYGTCLDA